MIPQTILNEVIRCLGKSLGQKVDIQGFRSASGGCINHGGRLTTSAGNFFIKWNNAERFPQMFEAEAKGLKLLKEPQSIDIPEVLGVGEAGGLSFLLLEYIEAGPRNHRYWQELGEQLADLHGNKADEFGLEQDNYIGSLPQANKQHSIWTAFFIEERLEPQLSMATRNRKVDNLHRQKFEKLYQKLPGLLADHERPSLIHGDLWSGNLMTNKEGMPCLIDPAVYYGNREIELAFTTLFGGFDHEFYKVYQAVMPMAPGYEERFDMYNLYPLMVHVNLFGGGYLRQVESILRKFT